MLTIAFPSFGSLCKMKQMCNWSEMDKKTVQKGVWCSDRNNIGNNNICHLDTSSIDLIDTFISGVDCWSPFLKWVWSHKIKKASGIYMTLILEWREFRNNLHAITSLYYRQKVNHSLHTDHLFNMHVSPLAFLNQINLSQLLLVSFWWHFLHLWLCSSKQSACVIPSVSVSPVFSKP